MLNIPHNNILHCKRIYVFFFKSPKSTSDGEVNCICKESTYYSGIGEGKVHSKYH